MSVVAVDPERLRLWARTWQETGEALVAVRYAELRAMTSEQALQATERLLSLGAQTPLSTERRGSSGLVEQQTLFARLRP
ncbi:MAG TPA: hypothetical protein VMX54_14510 [Vicinamibacteria bacterium]|nr:hypothetical protein [Vicinamibacteria bacterium]